MRAQGGPQKLRFTVLTCSSEDAVSKCYSYDKETSSCWSRASPLDPERNPAGRSSPRAPISQPTDSGVGLVEVRRDPHGMGGEGWADLHNSQHTQLGYKPDSVNAFPQPCCC